MRLQIQQWSSFISAAPLYSGSFDKKLQDPLLLPPSFSCGKNCRALVQSNSVLPFFDKEFKMATQKHTCLFGTLRSWSPWWETVGPLDFASSASFSCGRNYRTPVESNSVLLFFDGEFQCLNFSINGSCMILSRTILTSIFSSFVVKT